jgi:hypothetical protein
MKILRFKQAWYTGILDLVLARNMVYCILFLCVLLLDFIVIVSSIVNLDSFIEVFSRFEIESKLPLQKWLHTPAQEVTVSTLSI